MATINIKLMASRMKPTIEIETNLTPRSVLIDTGAHTAIRFDNEQTLLSEFPNANATKMVTFIGGLGGMHNIPCPVYEIPEFIFKDMDSDRKMIIHNLPIALYDSDKDYGYDILLGGTIFMKANYAFMNAEKIRHMRIWIERDIYCFPKLVMDIITGKPTLYEGNNILSSVGIFFQNEGQSDI